MKLKSLIASILIIQVLLQPCLVAHSDQVFEVENLSDMLEQVEAIEIQFTGDDEQGFFSYTVLGTEAVDTKPSWKVETVFGETGDEQSYTIWVDQSTGKTLKAEIEGQEFTGMFAEMYGNITLSFFMGFVYNYWHSWTYQEFIEWGNSGLGTATYLGKEVQTFGPTTLETWGIRYEGYSVGDETVNYQFEVWYAPTQFGGIMTYMSVSATGQESYDFELELQSISLVEDQQIPSDFIELVESETEPESEEETEPEPEEETEPEPEEETETEPEEETEPEPEEETEPEPEEEQGGGIPGFPMYAILLALITMILLIRRDNKL
jgi:hypothetical protein